MAASGMTRSGVERTFQRVQAVDGERYIRFVPEGEIHPRIVAGSTMSFFVFLRSSEQIRIGAPSTTNFTLGIFFGEGAEQVGPTFHPSAMPKLVSFTACVHTYKVKFNAPLLEGSVWDSVAGPMEIRITICSDSTDFEVDVGKAIVVKPKANK